MDFIARHPLTQMQMIVMIGLAASAFMTFLTIYDIVSKIDEKEISCENNDATLKKANETRFIVMITLAVVAVFVGIIGMMGVFYAKKFNWLFLPISILLAGIIGAIYSVGLKLRGNNKAKLGISLAFLGLFILLGVGVGLGKFGRSAPYGYKPGMDIGKPLETIKFTN